MRTGVGVARDRAADEEHVGSVRKARFQPLDERVLAGPARPDDGGEAGKRQRPADRQREAGPRKADIEIERAHARPASRRPLSV